MNNRCKTKGKWNESVIDRIIDGAHQSFSMASSREAVKTRPNSWAKQVREIEWGHWTLDFMTF